MRKEIKKIALPKGWKAIFSPSKTPGLGSFCVSGRWNGASFKYEREVIDYGREVDNEIYIHLKRRGDEIFITIDEGGIYSVDVNDCKYVNPANSFCCDERAPWREKTPHEEECDEAMEFGGKVAKSLRGHLVKVANPLYMLIDNYCTGRLLHPESRDVPRSHKHIYDKFDLTP